jgi:hypothetical protein
LIETTSAIPAPLVREFTAAICAHLQQADRPLTEAADVRQLIEQCPDPAADELTAFIDRVTALPADRQQEFADAIDETQTSSKLWLIDQLTRHTDLADASILVIGAWYGILPLLINWTVRPQPARMLCLDIDPAACDLGRSVIGALYPNIAYQVADAMQLDYSSAAGQRPSIIVNTICEHLPDAAGWWRRIPAGALAVMQSNNYAPCPDHVNWVPDVAAMKAQTPLSTVLFEGVLPTTVLDRFMLIGYR